MVFNKKKIKHKLIIIGFYLLRIIPIKKNKIVISSFSGKGYGSEGSAICNELLKKKYKFDIVWLCDDVKSSFPAGIRAVRFNTLNSMYELATAKVWIDNRRKDMFIRKRRNQYYIQAWHGNVCIKKVEKDADSLPKSYIEKAKSDSKMADIFVSGSKWRDANYRNAFWYDGEIVHGDLYNTRYYLNNQETIKRDVCKHFNLISDSKIILYAPTFRQDSRLDCYDLDYNRLMEAAKKRFGGDWAVIIRLHPNVSKLNQYIEYDNRILNGTDYPQIYELISACDILVSDYSGVIFDGFRFKKYVFLYASDIDRYLREERGMYFDFKNMPSPLSTNNEEIEKTLIQFDERKYESRRVSFVNKLGYYDENAARIIADRIEKVVMGGN